MDHKLIVRTISKDLFVVIIATMSLVLTPIILPVFFLWAYFDRLIIAAKKPRTLGDNPVDAGLQPKTENIKLYRL